MSRAPSHPPTEQIELLRVLDCLRDPTRLAIVVTLAGAHASAELRCGDFNTLSSKSNLSYHFVKLRDAGLMRSRVVGTGHFVQLRRDDLEERLPGLLDAVLTLATQDRDVRRLLQAHR